MTAERAQLTAEPPHEAVRVAGVPEREQSLYDFIAAGARDGFLECMQSEVAQAIGTTDRTVRTLQVQLVSRGAISISGDKRRGLTYFVHGPLQQFADAPSGLESGRKSAASDHTRPTASSSSSPLPEVASGVRRRSGNWATSGSASDQNYPVARLVGIGIDAQPEALRALGELECEADREEVYRRCRETTEQQLEPVKPRYVVRACDSVQRAVVGGNPWWRTPLAERVLQLERDDPDPTGVSPEPITAPAEQPPAPPEEITAETITSPVADGPPLQRPAVVGQLRTVYRRAVRPRLLALDRALGGPQR